ncbi:reducing type I polyketide synthase [Corynespora cassiicola Philippines]|uniref:Reducing type I polyketide synthase n=1 Tax=Corynespora cassiicola Philippines TaxID=1448308 RepID=A0A2T2PAM1_CORCC|nr:reducing type I polyketide synthase [Corynespora cassiicola Philippines]
MEPIAVIGISLKLPGDAVSVEALWDILNKQKCTKTDWPADRAPIGSFHDPERKEGGATMLARGGNFLKEDPAKFDSSFFSIPAYEAISMDPQQRILLETTYKALENAGIPLQNSHQSETGVFVGCMSDDYKVNLHNDIDSLPTYAATGTGQSMLANRLSWFFDLHGPSIAVDSACSSSLMALDLACQSLRCGDSSMARSNSPHKTNACANIDFDERANGYARSEGAAVVIIKRLSNAIADNDTIRAVIRSTASNSDGYTPGITQPSERSQADLIKKTYAKADLSLEDTRFFEAHGTLAGDPIEAAAIGCVFGSYRSDSEPLYIGALKSNIGHLEGASGIAGFVKAVLAVEKGVIPPNLSPRRLNPKIKDADFHMKVTISTIPSAKVRRASINSFGYGGSNTHVVIDDAFSYLRSRGIIGNHNSAINSSAIFTDDGLDTTTPDSNSNSGWLKLKSPKLLVWSSADESALLRTTKSLESYTKVIKTQIIDERPDIKDIAYTLSFRRSNLAWRSYALAEELSDLEGLTEMTTKPKRSSTNLGALMVFTGQGAQYARMGIQLLSFDVFRETLEAFDSELSQLGCEWSLIDELLADGSTTKIDQPGLSLPIRTGLQIALYELIRCFGLEPKAVVGHSSGEIAAAYACGALSFSSACKVSYHRGRLAESLLGTTGSGAMLAVGISVSSIAPYLETLANLNGSQLTVACINSPTNITVSGDKESIDYLSIFLESDGIFTRELNTGLAYHSPQMLRIAQEYLNSMGELTAKEGLYSSMNMASSLTGEIITDTDVLRSPQYWVDNMTSPVRFSDAIEKILSDSQAELYDIIELGPHSALQRPIQEIMSHVGCEKRYASVLSKFDSSIKSTLKVAGDLFSLGYPINLGKVNNIDSENITDHKCLVDLPEYSFSRGMTRLYETPLAKTHRMRPHYPRPLLGAPISAWNPLEAKWRRYLNIRDKSWFADHQVNGLVLFPAAGMIAISLDAVQQLLPKTSKVESFLVKEAIFSNPIIIPQDEGDSAEIETVARQNALLGTDTISWYQIRVLVRAGEGWKEACSSTVKVQFETHVGTLSENELYQLKRAKAFGNRLFSEKNIPADSHKVYKTFSKMGLQYGPAFQGLQDIVWNGEDGARANIVPKPTLDHEKADPYLIHPATLDAIIQLSIVPLTKGGSKLPPTCLPTGIKNALFSSKLADRTNPSLYAYSESKLRGFQGGGSETYVAGPNGDVVISIERLEVTIISSRPSDPVTAAHRRLCFTMDEKPDIELLTSNQISTLIKTGTNSNEDQSNYYRDHTRALAWFISETLKQLTETDLLQAAPHMKNYIDWMIFQAERNQRPTMFWSSIQCCYVDMNDEPARESFLRVLEKANKVGQLAVTVGRNLLPIISGKVNPRELFFDPGLVEEFYEDVYESSGSSEKLARYVELLGHKNPAMSILEVGAGSASSTRNVLDRLMNQTGGDAMHPRFSRYDFTDISSSFFEHANEEFADVVKAGRMNFRLLDLERNPVEQGYGSDRYDVIIASLVLYATQDLRKTLRYLHSLLKPGVQPEILRTGFILGTLPGWWNKTDQKDGFRQWSPNVRAENWDTLLQECGFSGTDAVVKDHDSEVAHEMSLMVSTAVSELTSATRRLSHTIIIDMDSREQQHVARELQKRLSKSEVTSFQNLDATKIPRNGLVVFLVELDSNFLADLSEESFAELKKILLYGSRFLWVTKSDEMSETWASRNMILGLARVFRSENPNKLFRTLALETSGSVYRNVEVMASIVDQISQSEEEQGQENEFFVRGQVVHTRRIAEAKYLDSMVNDRTVPQHRTQTYHDAGPISLTIQSPGILDSLCWVDDESQGAPLKADEILIEPLQWNIDNYDTLATLGKSTAAMFGKDCCGIIRKVPKTSRFQVGDRVCSFSPGGIRSMVRCTEDLVFHIPETLDTKLAASLSTAAITAYYSVIKAGALRKDESILIHHAASPTGQLCIQLAQHIGASKIFVTVSSHQQRDLLMSQFGLSSCTILSEDPSHFKPAILRQLDDEGIDVVVNTLSGEGLLASWDLVASFGRFINIGDGSAKPEVDLPLHQSDKGVSFMSFSIQGLLEKRHSMARKLFEPVMELVKKGIVQPPIAAQSFSLTEVQSAFKLVQDEVSPNEMVQTYTTRAPTLRLDEDASYVIAGGLGGLGRSTARWMVSRGARHLILLSRSGMASEQAQRFVHELTEIGVQVWAPPCDISRIDQLETLLEGCKLSMPPIKGCIQGTMVLRDALLENMSYSDWCKGTVSKTDTSWNLHHTLPKRMDFFVMLSSLSGIVGLMGQSNYAAGNTFQDALAVHRRSIGEKAVALDLGVMGNVGIVAENDDYMHQRQAGQDILQVEELEFHALLEYYCDPQKNISQPMSSTQVLVGLPTHQLLRSNGMEPPTSTCVPMFSLVAQLDTDGEGSEVNTSGSLGVNYAEEFAKVSSQADAEVVVGLGLAMKLSVSLRLSVDEIDTSKPLYHYGVDSLFVVELRNWIGKTFAANVSVSDLVGAPSIEMVVRIVVDSSALRGVES